LASTGPVPQLPMFPAVRSTAMEQSKGSASNGTTRRGEAQKGAGTWAFTDNNNEEKLPEPPPPPSSRRRLQPTTSSRGGTIGGNAMAC
jgi:hypothetical protein